MIDKGFDPRCGELADIFVADEAPAVVTKRDALAQTIQDAIEDWLEDMRARCPRCGSTNVMRVPDGTHPENGDKETCADCGK